MKKSLRGRRVNIAEDLKSLRERAKLSRSKLAELAGYGRGTSLARYEDPQYMGGRKLPVEVVAKLETVLFGRGDPPITKAEIWALAETGSALVITPVAAISVPVFSWESLRNGVEMLGKIRPEEHVQIPGLAMGNYAASRVLDDHCETEASKGSVVIIDLDDREPRSGKIYAVILDGRLVLRRYAPNPERWESLAARSEASVYPAQTIPIIGRLVRALKEYS